MAKSASPVRAPGASGGSLLDFDGSEERCPDVYPVVAADALEPAPSRTNNPAIQDRTGQRPSVPASCGISKSEYPSVPIISRHFVDQHGDKVGVAISNHHLPDRLARRPLPAESYHYAGPYTRK